MRTIYPVSIRGETRRRRFLTRSPGSASRGLPPSVPGPSRRSSRWWRRPAHDTSRSPETRPDQRSASVPRLHESERFSGIDSVSRANQVAAPPAVHPITTTSPAAGSRASPRNRSFFMGALPRTRASHCFGPDSSMGAGGSGNQREPLFTRDLCLVSPIRQVVHPTSCSGRKPAIIRQSAGRIVSSAAGFRLWSWGADHQRTH